jgi:hypothetical protein
MEENVSPEEGAQIDISSATRFVDTIVKIAIFLSFALFLLSLYIYRFKAGTLYQKQIAVCDVVLSQGIEDNTKTDNPIQRLFIGAKSDCFARAVRMSDIWSKIAFISLDITLLIPIVYFEGKKLVKNTAEKIIKKDQFMQSG